MRIGLLTTSFPRSAQDTAGHFVLGMARALAARGHGVEVLAPEPAERIEPPPLEGISLRWVPYLRPRALERTFYGAGVPDNLRRDARAWLGLVPFSVALHRAATERRESWDALLSHWAVPCGVVAAAVRGARPHVAVVHSADLFALERLPFGGRLARHVARGATAVVCVSPSHRDRFLALLPPLARAGVAGRCHVSTMGVEAPPDPAEPRRALRERLGVSRAFVVLAMGRLVPIKGLDVALRAAAQLPGAELVIAGDGPERPRLTALGHALGVRTRFVGVVVGEAKQDWLRAADVLVVPSRALRSGRTEGVPTILLEAMACGLPVVASRTGGVPSVVADGRAGLLVPPGEPAALASALRSLQADPRLRRRLGRAGRGRSGAHLWSEIAPRLEALLLGESVFGSAAPPAAARAPRNGRHPAAGIGRWRRSRGGSTASR